MRKEMKGAKAISFNFIMNALLTMSSFLFPLITFPYISRVLLAEGVGKVSFASSFASLFLLFANLGIPIYGVRACAQVRDDKVQLTRTVHEIFFINFVMSSLAYICLGVAICLIPKLANDKSLYLISSLVIFFNLIGVEWVYKALEQYMYITIRSITFKIIALLAMFLLVQSKDDYLLYAGISIFASSVSGILNFIRIKKFLLISNVGNYNVTRHINSIIVFFAMSCATTVYTNLDNLMLGFMCADSEVGYYTIAIKVKNILASLVSSLGIVLLPRVSYYVKNKMHKDFYNVTDKAIAFVIMLSLPLIAYFEIYTSECISILASQAFDASVLLMKILLPTLFFIGLTNIMGMEILVPLEKENLVFYSVCSGALVDAMINFILIPVLGAVGAAIGTLIAEMVVFGIQVFILRSVFWNAIKKISWYKIIISIICASFVAVMLKRLVLISILKMCISFACFVGVYVLILCFFRERNILAFIKQIFKRR